MTMHLPLTVARYSVFIVALASSASAQSVDLPEKVTYNRHIRPILSQACFQCHGHDAHARKAGRRLDEMAGALAENKGVRAVVPGRPELSELIKRVRSADPKRRMPPPKSKKPPLTPRQIALLDKWIAQGGEYQKHWSFIAPTKPVVPKGEGHNPIDRFVDARRKSVGLQPSSPANRRVLIRRVTLDLLGLPPKPADVEAFVSDKSDRAYEKVVDRLLASPHYGERMAVSWMDAARYGDTSAYHADGVRQMWAWRDWVVDSFNKNLPYDQFTVAQIAGDLIPNGSMAKKIASAFNRNHCSSDEGGAFPEELRVGYVVDRVKTTSMVWLGLTMECCQCHSHKYDPITQKEYYSFYAFFNTTSDPGMQTRGGNQKPTLGVVDSEKMSKVPALRSRLGEIVNEITGRVESAEPLFEKWLADQPKSATTSPADMIAHYPLDKSIANVAAQKGEKIASDAKVHGVKKWAKAKHGSGLRFNGKNWVDLGDVGDFERTDRFSYGAWVYSEAKNFGAPLARMHDGKQFRGWDMYVGGGRGVTMHLIHNYPKNYLKVTTKKKLKHRKWHHVFVTYDGSSSAKGVKIYVDGAHWPTKADHDNLSESTRNKVPLYLGRRNPGSPFRGMVDDVRIYSRTLSAVEIAVLAGNDPVGDLLRTPEDKRTEKLIAPARELYLTKHDKKWVQLSRDRTAEQKKIDAASAPVTTVMVMEEQKKPRKTFMLNRGSYDQPTKVQVQPGVPASLPPFGNRPATRLGLAQWLVDPNHPLTARVTVNRLWFEIFGLGIVKTVEDFGAQGQFPSHPDLLDWLATDFIENGWDVKRLMRMMVTSATYRQSASVTRETRKRDPENTYLARGPRMRMHAEFIRDVALSVSGLLVRKLGGPGVKPYQPSGLWNEVSINRGLRFRQDHGEKLYRRSLYTYWKRSAPPPALRIFDAPTRERCVIRRSLTNTPLQALITLNDPQFIEAARFLAQRMIFEGGKSLENRVGFAYRLVLARPAKPDEIEIFRDTLAPILADYRNDKSKAEAFLAIGESKRDATIDASEHAAWTVLASMILNLDEALTK
jgi:hypothetical protein